jgi:hypothetical protein
MVISHAKDPYVIVHTKINSKRIKAHDVQAKTTKLFKEK